jgi:hypothetical protein
MPTITIYRPGQPVEVLDGDVAGYPTLPMLQGWVEGYIQPVYFNDDPCGYWHVGYANEEGVIHRMRYNPAASRVFSRYQDGLVGPVVALEGFERFWWHSKSEWVPVRAATREECLAASQGHGPEEIEEGGCSLVLGERGG